MPNRSLLARIANRLRRQPGQQSLDRDADEPTPGTETESEATGSGNTEAPEGAGGVRRSPIGRVLATLSNKWIWIPGASVMVLALAGALLMLVLQSAQEKERLRAELRATQEKLEQATAVKHVEASSAVPGQVKDSSYPGSGGPGKKSLTVDVEDCLVTDKESVTRSLRNCIDSFNDSTAKTFLSGKSP